MKNTKHFFLLSIFAIIICNSVVAQNELKFYTDSRTITYAYGKARDVLWEALNNEIIVSDSLVIFIEGRYHYQTKYKVDSKDSAHSWYCSRIKTNERGLHDEVELVLIDNYLDWTEQGFTYRYHISNIEKK